MKHRIFILFFFFYHICDWCIVLHGFLAGWFLFIWVGFKLCLGWKLQYDLVTIAERIQNC